jgi:hypothetical protein
MEGGVARGKGEGSASYTRAFEIANWTFVVADAAWIRGGSHDAHDEGLVHQSLLGSGGYQCVL